jgi:hypothetical protein
MEYVIKMFLKFGSLENITDLYNNGTIYLNTIEYFRNLEDNKLRGDRYEGVIKITNSLPGVLSIPGIDKEIKYQKVHLRTSYDTILGNLYCLYCLSNHGFPDLLEFKIDKRNMRFGTHCLMIKDNVYFFNKIKSELRKNGFKFFHGFVDYYNKETINKELTLFEKPSEFEYQKEFRFYVINKALKPIIIHIGSLVKYSEIFKMEEIIELRTKLKELASPEWK